MITSDKDRARLAALFIRDKASEEADKIKKASENNRTYTLSHSNGRFNPLVEHIQLIAEYPFPPRSEFDAPENFTACQRTGFYLNKGSLTLDNPALGKFVQCYTYLLNEHENSKNKK